MEAAASLTRVFMKLRKRGKLAVAPGVPQDSPQTQIVTWLNERYLDFVNHLTSLLKSEKGNLQVRLLSGLRMLIVVDFINFVSTAC
jgi:hypothetical protein